MKCSTHLVAAGGPRCRKGAHVGPSKPEHLEHVIQHGGGAANRDNRGSAAGSGKHSWPHVGLRGLPSVWHGSVRPAAQWSPDGGAASARG